MKYRRVNAKYTSHLYEPSFGIFIRLEIENRKPEKSALSPFFTPAFFSQLGGVSKYLKDGAKTQFGHRSRTFLWGGKNMSPWPVYQSPNMNLRPKTFVTL